MILNEPPSNRRVREDRRWTHLRAFNLIVGTFLLLTLFFQLTYVDGSSMASTLNHGDRLFIDKVSPQLWELNHGDIVVFSPQGSHDQYIKRLIAREKDIVEIRNGTLWRNGIRVVEDYVTLPDHANFPKMTIPRGHIFVLGDNRISSEDSRVWGFVPVEFVKGVARFRFWPLDRLGAI